MRIEVSVNINRPPSEVFAFITDFTKNSLWQSGVKSATFTSDGPLAVGSTYTQKSEFLGKQIDFAFVVTEYEPGRRVKFKTTSGTFPVQIERSVEPITNGTRVTAIIEGEPGGLFKIATPLLKFMTQRQIAGDYRNLKKVLESQ